MLPAPPVMDTPPRTTEAMTFGDTTMNAESTTSTMRSHTATGLNAQPITPEAMPKIPTMHWKITHTVPAMVPSRISEGLKINEYGMINAGSESPTASHPVFIGGDFASPAAAYAEIATGGVIPENTPKYSANMWLAIVLQPIFISAGTAIAATMI